MRPGADPCLRVIVTGLEDAACRLGLGATQHRATKAHPVGATFIGLVYRLNRHARVWSRAGKHAPRGRAFLFILAG